MKSTNQSVNKFDFFKNFFLFKDFHEDEIQSITKFSTEKSYKKNEIIYRQDDTTNNIFFVVKGHVAKFVRYASNREIIVAIKGENTLFGELAPLANLNCTDTAVAIEYTYLLELDKTIYIDILLNHPDILLELSGKLFEYLIKSSNNKINAINLKSEAKLAYTLTNFTNKKDHYNQFLFVTHDMLAATSGLSRQTTSSILSNWNKNKIIETKKGALRILDLQALIDIVIEAELNI